MIDKIISIDTDINSWYRESKLPKFIKKIIAKNRRHKLKKYISKYASRIYKYDDIYTFFDYALRYYPPKGAIKSIVSIDEKTALRKRSLIGFLRYGTSADHITYLYDVSVNNYEDTINIRVTIQTNESIKRFDLKKRKMLVAEHDESEIVSNLIGGLNSLISVGIETMLLEVLHRSERIYEL